MRRGLCIALLTSLLGCTPTLFACDDDTSCGGGTCVDTGYCAFPDSSCDSGLRYGEYSPADLANACVPLPQEAMETETSTSSPPDDDPGPIEPTTDAGSTGVTGSSSTGGGESTTGTAVEDPSCGDGNVDPDEACDDGNEADGDACNADCQISGELVWIAELDTVTHMRGIAAAGDAVIVGGRSGGSLGSYLGRFTLDGTLDAEAAFDATASDDGIRSLAMNDGYAVVVGRADGVGPPTTWIGNLDPGSLELSDVRTVWQGRAHDVSIHEGAAIVAGSEGPSLSLEEQRVASVPLPVQAESIIEDVFAPSIRGTVSQVVVDGVFVGAGIRSINPNLTGVAVAYAGLPMDEEPIWEFSGVFGHAWTQSVACRDGACFLAGFVALDIAIEDPPREARVWRIGDRAWTSGFQGAELSHANEAETIVLASNGDPIVGGFLGDPATGPDLWISRFSPDGEERWRFTYDVTGVDDKVRSLVLHEERIFLVGEVEDHAIVAEVTR